jgi:hypothetical protein
VSDPQVRALRAKVRAVEIDVATPVEAAHVSIRHVDGTSLDVSEMAATGSLARPMTDAALREKFATLARYGCPALDAGALAEKLWALPELGDAGAVMALARPQI